jgi:hypothetical protein
MRGSSNLHFRRRTKPGNLYLKMRFVIVLLWKNRNQNTSLVYLCCQK